LGSVTPAKNIVDPSTKVREVPAAVEEEVPRNVPSAVTEVVDWMASLSVLNPATVDAPFPTSINVMPPGALSCS
jgi:hypothetical protein